MGGDDGLRDGPLYELEQCELILIVSTCRSRDKREQRLTESVQGTRPSSTFARIKRPEGTSCVSSKELARDRTSPDLTDGLLACESEMTSTKARGLAIRRGVVRIRGEEVDHKPG